MPDTLPITLAIDTAAPRLQLGLLLADGRTDVSVDEIATGHAELIFARIAALLARNGIGYADLQRVVTTTGPGSFTGLRIGLSAARGIGLARRIPVVGVSSLVAQSLTAPPEKGTTVLLDARRGEMYGQEFFGPGVAVSDDFIVPCEQAFAGLNKDKAGWSLVLKFTQVLGTGAAQAAEATGATNLELLRPEADRGFIDIAALARHGATLDPTNNPPEPNYIRDADAKPQTAARIERRGA